MLLHQATRFRVPGCLDAFSPERSGFTRPLYAIRDGRVARLDFTDPGLDALPALHDLFKILWEGSFSFA